MKVFTAVVCTLLVVIVLFMALTVPGRNLWNSWIYGLEKADEASYETRKVVEDTARAMIASYKSDVEMYRAYKDNTDAKLVSYAEAAKLRAIRTATTYNEYILKNSYVWKNNVPADIYQTLDVKIE